VSFSLTWLYVVPATRFDAHGVLGLCLRHWEDGNDGVGSQGTTFKNRWHHQRYYARYTVE